MVIVGLPAFTMPLMNYDIVLAKGAKRYNIYTILNIPNIKRVKVVSSVRAPLASVVRPVATAALTPLFKISVVFNLKST